jgi:hypothetical protein
MRDGPRRLPLIALGALGALIALILAGTYVHLTAGTVVLALSVSHQSPISSQLCPCSP